MANPWTGPGYSYGQSPRAQTARANMARGRETGVLQPQDRYQNIIASYQSANVGILQDLKVSTAVMLQAEARSFIGNNVLTLVKGLEESVKLFQDAMSRELQEGRDDLLQMYAEIGREAQNAVTAAYKSSIRQESLRYRGADLGRFRRFSGGKMMQALSGEGVVRVSPEGLQFMIIPELDAQAPQWYRLNFGAMPGSGKRPAAAPKIKIFDAQVEGVSLSNYRPSPAFRVPPGIWSSEIRDQTSADIKPDNATPGAFYPLSLLMRQGNVRSHSSGNEKMNKEETAEALPNWNASAARMSKGIQARNFFDAGVNIINRRLGPSIEYLFRKWVNEAASSARSGPLAVAGLEQRSAQNVMSILNRRLQADAQGVDRNRAATIKQLEKIAVDINGSAGTRVFSTLGVRSSQVRLSGFQK